MASYKTPNIALNKWAETDYFKRIEVNENFDKIDDQFSKVNDKIGILKKNAVSVLEHGATGDGTTDDTIAIQQVVDELLSPTGKLILVVPGSYLLTENVTLPSNTKIEGAGGEIFSNYQDHYLFAVIGEDHVDFHALKAYATETTGTNDAKAAILFTPNDKQCWDNIVRFCSLKDVSWGVLSTAESGTGDLRNTRYIGNAVHSSTPDTNYDGLHIVGRIINAVIAANAVMNRGDAGIAVNMISTHQGYGFAVVGNASTDNLVGVDLSGSRYGVVVGNSCKNTIAHNKSNPAIRAIKYNGSAPQDLIIGHNYAITNTTNSNENDMKVDSAGDDTHILVSGNITKKFYTNARYVEIMGNVFKDGGHINLDNNAGEIFIGENVFEGAFDIYGPGNPGLAGNVYIAKQKWKKSNPSNFLPNYSPSRPFWASKFFFDGDIIPIVQSPFSTSSASYVDIPNAFLVLRYPAVIDDIIAFADCQTHSGYVAITDLSDNVQCEARFSVTAGAGGTNVICGLNSPVMSGHVYKVKLPAGIYKLRARSELNSLTIKNVAVSIWC